MPLRIRWGSLRTKIIAWSVVPTIIILVAVAVVVFLAYQDVTKDPALDLNRELAALTASNLTAQLKEHAHLLTAEARTPGISGADPVARRDALRGARSRLAVFDGGTLILDTSGTVVAAEPERGDILGQNWSDRSYYRQMVPREGSGSPGTVYSDIVTDGPGGAPVIAIAVPIRGARAEFLGLLTGMFRVSTTAENAFYGSILRLRQGKSGNSYLVDSQGHVIFHSVSERIGEDVSARGVVHRVLSDEVDSVRTHDLEGQGVIASFAPVPDTPWGLVIEESWPTPARASRGYQRLLLLLLLLGMAVPALVIALGVRRLTRPIGELIEAAKKVADGDFGHRISAQTGDEVEELAQQFNLMAGQLQESYARLQRTVAERTRELAGVNAIAAVVSQSLDLDAILNDALDTTLQVMGIEAGGFYLLDEVEGVLNVAASRGLSPQLVAEVDRLQVGEGFSGRVVRTGQPVVVRDVSADPRLTRMVVREEGLRSLAAIPLSSRGKVLGTLFAVTRGYREFTDRDIQLLVSIGHQIGIAVENARLFGQAEQRLHELEALYCADEEMHRHLDPDQVLQALVDVAVDILRADKSSVFVWDSAKEQLVMRVARGFSPRSVITLRFARGEGTAWKVASSGEPIFVGEAPMDPRLAGEREAVVQTLASEGIRSFMHLPIRISGEVLGVFNVCYGEPYAFGKGEQRLFAALAQRAALAIDNAQLFTIEQRRAEQFRVISEVGRRITSIRPFEELLDPMARLIQRAFGYYHVAIGLVEGDEVVFEVGAGPLWDDPDFQIQPGHLKVGQEGITGWVASTGTPLLVPDVSQEPRYVLMRGCDTRSELTVPLKAKGRVIGVLDVQSDQLDAFDASDLLVLQSLAHQAAIAIENARLFRAEQRRAEQFRVISEVGRRITSILAVDELLDQVARLIKEALGYYGVGIGLVEGDEVVFRAGAGASWDDTERHESLRLKIGAEGLTGWVAATGEALLVPDVSQEPRFYYVPEVSETQSEICVPLRTKGKVIGVLGAQSDRLNGFDHSDLVVLQALADQAAVAIETARLYEQAQQLAVMEERQRLARELHDAVTQTLFSASLIAEALPELWQTDPKEGQQLLKELRQLSRGALAEMRTLLLELRPAALVEANLPDLLRQLGEAVTGRTGIPTEVLVEGTWRPPSDVHVALYRIAQEALNNVVKHAEASQVLVHLNCTGPSTDDDQKQNCRVTLLVQDNGRGFVMSRIPTDRLGLRIMRERADSIGAELEIKGEPRAGTQITVAWNEGTAGQSEDATQRGHGE